MTRTRSLFPVLMALVLISGCQRTTVVVAPFTTTLQVAPDLIRGGDGFLVTLSITNRANDVLALSSPNGCVTSLTVRRSRQAVPLAGTEFGCTAARTTFEFGPRETVAFQFRLEATIEGSDKKIPDPGAYEVTANLHLSLPAVTQSFMILAPEVDEDQNRNQTTF